jgi:hypothetical protein
LPFSKNSKRDEIFSAKEAYHKIAPAFSMSEKNEEVGKAVLSLREYLKQY